MLIKRFSDAQRDLVFLCGLAAFFLMWHLGRGSLASWDEACYAVVSREIVRSGDWIVFRWPGGGLFFDKPPLYFWLTAFFYKIFGIGEWATRLPSALGGVGLVGVTYALGRRLYGRTAGLAGAGVMLTSLDFLRYARFGTMDILQLFFFTAAILAYLGAVERQARWGWFGAASAGCFLTKGPLVILAWAAIAVHMAVSGRRKELFAPAFWLGVLLFALLVIPWHVAAFRSSPDAFWQDYVIKNYFIRGSKALDGHEGNIFFYAQVMWERYRPWVILVPPAVVLAVRRWRLASSQDSSRDLLLLTWIGVVFVFFTFCVKTKLNWYILPLDPALSILVGVCLADWLPSRWLWLLKPMFVTALLVHIPVSSLFGADYTPGIRQLAPIIQGKMPPRSPVYLFNYHEQPSALFYWDRPVAYIDTSEALDELQSREKSIWLAVPDALYTPNAAALEARGFRVVVHTTAPRGRLYLLKSGE